MCKSAPFFQTHYRFPISVYNYLTCFTCSGVMNDKRRTFLLKNDNTAHIIMPSHDELMRKIISCCQAKKRIFRVFFFVRVSSHKQLQCYTSINKLYDASHYFCFLFPEENLQLTFGWLVFPFKKLFLFHLRNEIWNPMRHRFIAASILYTFYHHF